MKKRADSQVSIERNPLSHKLEVILSRLDQMQGGFVNTPEMPGKFPGTVTDQQTGLPIEWCNIEVYNDCGSWHAWG